jgi:hypothetical protein
MIEERKHEEWNNKQDSKKIENRQNNFDGDLHPWGVVVIT